MAATKFVEVKSSNINGIFEIVANRGICWLVKDEDGSTFQVQKKLVVRGPWEEDEDEPTPTPAPVPGSVAVQLSAAASAPKKAKDEPAPRDPDLVTLKQVCFDLGIEPRIARRRLRGAIGNVGTGSRWEWKKDSAELVKVLETLTPKTAE